MKFTVKQLLPADISNKTAFQLVQFTRALAFALESIYFDQLLMHTGTEEARQHPDSQADEDEAPF